MVVQSRVPLEWYPKLATASPQQLQNWTLCAAGYGIHWPDIDEDLSTEGMLRGAPAPGVRRESRTKRSTRPRPLAREGMGERVSHRAGNALSDELGNDAWDVVFLSQLVHHFTDEQNRDFMGRIARALRPGGVCVLLDTLRPSLPEGARGIGAVLDLYFAATSRSGTWSLETMQAWQRDAGLAVEKPVHLRTLPGAAMVVGRRPPARAA